MTRTARRDVEALEAALAASQARVLAAEAQIASLTLTIEKLRRALYGHHTHAWLRPLLPSHRVGS